LPDAVAPPIPPFTKGGQEGKLNAPAAAVVGLVLATTYRLGKANIPRITLGIALASVVAGAVLGVSAAVIVVAAGLLGVGLYALPLRPQAAREDTP
jgi:chromate transport protein ChrA